MIIEEARNGMWHWSRVVVIVTLLAAAAAGRPSHVSATAQQVPTAAPVDREPIPATPRDVRERLARLHHALSSLPDPQDAILEITRIGDATSVPFLIDALAKLATGPWPPPYLASPDTRFLVLDALQELTNHDAGPDAADWRAWFEQHRSRTREQWITEGFVERGLPASDPPDDAFVAALISASNPSYQPTYVRANALRRLRTLPSATVVRLARGLSRSKQSSDRRAIIAAFEHIGGTTRVDLLRDLAQDADVDIAENALRVLNEALRADLPRNVPVTVWDVRLAHDGVTILNVLDDRTVILGLGYGVLDATRVVGFDLVTHTIAWTYPTSDSVRSNAARLGDRLYFVSDDRVLHCVSLRGTPVWSTPLTTQPELGTTGPAITAALGRLFIPDDKAVYVATPDGRIQSYPMGEYVARHLVQAGQRVFAAIVGGPLLVFDDPAREPSRIDTGVKASALSASGNTVCIVGSGPGQQVQCLEHSGLRELWRARLPDDSGGYALVQDERQIYVLAQNRALAFETSSGTRRWATNEYRSFSPFQLLHGLVLTRTAHSTLEWREPVSGEVMAPWEEQARTGVRNAAFVGGRLLVEVSDSAGGAGLRLLDVSLPNATGKPR